MANETLTMVPAMRPQLSVATCRGTCRRRPALPETTRPARSVELFFL
jgi:hypothetical protein